MNVPSITQPSHITLLRNCVMTLPILCVNLEHIINWCKSRNQACSENQNCDGEDYTGSSGSQTGDSGFEDRYKTVKSVFFVGGLFFQVLGIAFIPPAITEIEAPNNSTINLDISFTVAGIICLSVAWLPCLNKSLLKISVKERTDKHNTQTSSEASSGTEVVRQPDDVLPIIVTFMAFCKMVFTVIFAFIILQFSVFEIDVSDVITHGWNDWQRKEIYYFISNCFSSLFGYVVSFIACTACMKSNSYVVPLVFASPITSVLFAAETPCNWLLIGGDCKIESDNDKVKGIAWFAAAVLCFALANFLSFGSMIIMNRTIVKQKESQVRTKIYLFLSNVD